MVQDRNPILLEETSILIFSGSAKDEDFNRSEVPIMRNAAGRSNHELHAHMPLAALKELSSVIARTERHRLILNGTQFRYRPGTRAILA
ncbi:hypothetical protein SD70_29930 [Gordoniibacillus kamchatkensis]|uniref:Uncharacterized protein n=1 Tax=Gordoniibacillus kamchatkensis TaxID=1590651 RepID=A0ABR5AA50_9BACL|nr:hypothetical protein SD70_29930 [Paenibacillus sp. VKM B-2647]